MCVELEPIKCVRVTSVADDDAAVTDVVIYSKKRKTIELLCKRSDIYRISSIIIGHADCILPWSQGPQADQSWSLVITSDLTIRNIIYDIY